MNSVPANALRRLSVRTLFLGVLLFSATCAMAADPLPVWLWHRSQAVENAATKERAYFRKSIEVAGGLKTAQLSVAADNHVVFYVNGQVMARGDEWGSPVRVDVAKQLKPGRNQLAAECLNDGGPAGFIARLKLEYGDNRQELVLTDESWKSHSLAADNWQQADFNEKDWNPAKVLAKLGGGPWRSIAMEGAPTPASGGSATAAEQLTLPAGFQAELLYTVPKAEQGSWVSLTADPKGRLIVSDQQGPLYRITVGAKPEETQVEKIDLPIGAAQGLLYAYDSLYVCVNGNQAQGSGVYRLQDTNGDDRFDQVELLRKLQGGGEHGPHGLRLGPDGRLWVIAGNHTKTPPDYDPNSPMRNFAEDLLLPRNPDGNGHATGVMAPGGWIASFDQHNSHWSLFCSGFRNPYDIAFNPEGELFTYDADMEWDTGAPWYRPTRVNHCTSGAEFGWRYGTGKWPAYYADSLGAVVDIGLGSPTGIEFGTGAKFPAAYQRALYINDWTYGKIYAVHLEPDGSSYRGTFEVFCQGKPLPVTDVCIHPDGALYFTVGGRGTQSGLYRVTYHGSEPTTPAGPLDTPKTVAARQLRHKLEAFHTQVDPQAVDICWPHLNSTDRALRFAARVAIERQELASWQPRALAETRPTAQIQALLALTRVADQPLQAQVLTRLNALPFAQLTEEQFLDALRVYQLALIRLGGKPADGGQSIVSAVDRYFPHDNELISRELCNLLIYLEAPQVVPRALERMSAGQTQQEQMFYAFVLRNVAQGWTLDQRKAHYSWMNLAESRYRGGNSFKKFVQQIRKDSTDKLTEADKTALAEVIEGRQQVEVVKLETTRQFVHNWQMPDLLPQLDQVTQGRSFERGLAAYTAGQCFKCHRFRGEGGDTGPDITGVGNRFDARYLLEALLDPSKVISDQYRGVILQTTDGRLITGRVVQEDDRQISVRVDPFARQPVNVLKSEIEAREPARHSEMPKDLINVLTKDEILDLVAYLRSGGSPDDKAFQKSP